MMTSKILFGVTLGILCIGLPTILSSICSAQQANVSIVDFTSEVVRQEQIAGKEARTFRFILVIRNSGNETSPDLVAKFADPEVGGNLSFFTTSGGHVSSFSLMPGESKALYASDWPTMLQDVISINVSFSPTNPQTPYTLYNSGYKVYTLPGVTKPKSSTPGFEIVFVLVAISVLLLSRKIKK
jgi:hypothetical protein